MCWDRASSSSLLISGIRQGRNGNAAFRTFTVQHLQKILCCNIHRLFSFLIFNVYCEPPFSPGPFLPHLSAAFSIVSHRGWLVLLSRFLPVDSASPLFACALFWERHHSSTIQNMTANSWSSQRNHTILRKKHTCIFVQMCF